MVKPGHIPNMLGQWRVVLKQAEESARHGRLNEALALLARPEVADHRQAAQLRGRLLHDLVKRARRRSQADDTAGAIDDLEVAERHGAAPDELAEARLAVAERVADDVRPALDAGDPTRALDRIDALAKQHVSGPALRRLREAAQSWKEALDEGRRGEFGRAREAFDRAGRLLTGAATEAMAAARTELTNRHEASQPRVERLYRALGAACDWGEILASAESLLEVVPEHAAARQARARAWQQIGALNPAAALPGRAPRAGRAPGLGLDLNAVVDAPQPQPAAPSEGTPIIFLGDTEDTGRFGAPAPAPRPAPRVETGPHGRLLLWADTVGGYLLCLDPEVVIGRAGHDSQADIPLLGDLSRRHASLIRQGDGYIVRAHQTCFINGRQVVGTAPLRDRDVLRLGSSVELLFRQPSPVSATARIEIVSRHRLPLAVEGVILMAETCIVGPAAQGHLPAPRLKQPVVLFRQAGQIWCRVPGSFDVDGRTVQGRAALTDHSNVQGDGFTFSLEPLGPRGATA